jgi:hypothetical protein
MRNPVHILVVAAAAAALAGCGASTEAAHVAPKPALPAALAHDLAARSDAIAASLADGDPCRAKRQAASLQSATVDAVNAGEVPSALQEELTSGVTDLVSRIRCTPARVNVSRKPKPPQAAPPSNAAGTAPPPVAAQAPAQAAPVAKSKPAKPKKQKKPKHAKKPKAPQPAVQQQQPPPPPPPPPTTTAQEDTPPMPVDPPAKGKGKKKDPPPPKQGGGNGKGGQ